MTKEKVHNSFLELITAQINQLQQAVNDLAESAANETKSTAGDKHETALAMLQIEQRNLKARLQEAREKKLLLEMNATSGTSVTVNKGSLVQTNQGWFYVSVAMGKLQIDGIIVISISPQSPLGYHLMGLRVNDEVKVNKLSYVVKFVG